MQVERHIEEHGHPLSSLHKGAVVEFDGGLYLHIVSPEEGKYRVACIETGAVFEVSGNRQVRLVEGKFIMTGYKKS